MIEKYAVMRPDGTLLLHVTLGDTPEAAQRKMEKWNFLPWASNRLRGYKLLIPPSVGSPALPIPPQYEQEITG